MIERPGEAGRTPARIVINPLSVGLVVRPRVALEANWSTSAGLSPRVRMARAPASGRPEERLCRQEGEQAAEGAQAVAQVAAGQVGEERALRSLASGPCRGLRHRLRFDRGARKT